MTVDNHVDDEAMEYSTKDEPSDPTSVTVPRTSDEEEESKEEESVDNLLKKDPFMDASDVINSMRSAIEEQLKQIEPPMPVYTRPIQRQHWGDIQVTPHKEWGDIFFDLFYVAGAYNLGNMLRLEPTLRGLFYFLACFFCLQNLWQQKMYFDSRFYIPSNDMFHNFYEMFTLVVLGTAVLYCRPVAILSNPEENNDLFVFCLAICIGMMLVIGRSLEVVWMIAGGEESTAARVTCKRDAGLLSPMTLLFAAAAVYAGVKYYGSDHSDSSYAATSEYDDHGYEYGEEETSHYGNSSSASDSYAYNSTESSSGVEDDSTHGEDHHLLRFLAGGGDSSYETSESSYNGDVSMGLLLAGFLVTHLMFFSRLTIIIPRGGDFRKVTVPMNIDYAIHRYGEWTMLMLGESVLSLLIVGGQQDVNYYTTFYCGILSISLLQFMYFQSQPHHADDHAMRRKKERGYGFVILVQLQSAALIVLGASYKMLLYEFVYEADDGHRRMLLPSLGGKLHRLLAGGEGPRFDAEDREQRVANFFCESMAAVWLFSDMLILIHKGIKEHMDRCQSTPKPALVKLLGIPLLLARIGLVVFMVTLSQYVTDPSYLSCIGLAGVLAQVVLRVVGTSLYREDTEDDAILEEIMKHGLKSQEFKLD